MYVGNLEAYQGVDLLLEAFAVAVGRGKDVGLVVVGGKPADVDGLPGDGRQAWDRGAHTFPRPQAAWPRWAAWSPPPTSWFPRGSRA